MKLHSTAGLVLALLTWTMAARADDAGADGGDAGMDAGDGGAMGSLLVLIDSSGSGKIKSQPAGIDCPSDCYTHFPIGTRVTLTALPDPGSAFGGWFGGTCSGTAPCVVTVTAESSVIASFASLQGVPEGGSPEDAGASGDASTSDGSAPNAGASLTTYTSGGGCAQTGAASTGGATPLGGLAFAALGLGLGLRRCRGRAGRSARRTR